MADPPSSELLKILEKLDGQVWEGEAWRHMFGNNGPELQNHRGARWNPPGVPAIYCSLEHSTALAEADYLISVQPDRPAAKRTIYRLKIRLDNLLDVTKKSHLRELHIGEQELSDVNHAACQKIGGAAEWLDHDGLLVPSARHSGLNLVVFPRKQGPSANFEIVASEVITEDSR